jgi:hypothetical protein
MWQCSISNWGFIGPKRQGKIYNVELRTRGGQWCCGLWDGAGSTVSRALGHHRDDDVMVLGRSTALRVWGQREVDGVVGSRMSRARGGWWHCGLKDGVGSTAWWTLGHLMFEEDDGIAGLGMTWGWRCHGLRNGVGCTTSRAQGGLRCCKDDDVTSLGRGRWQRVKGARLWLGATARRL